MDLNTKYADRDYWEKRYEKEEHKEWLCDYESVRHILKPVIRPDDAILILGCGNSNFSRDIFDDGHANVTSVDYAESVIENMRERFPRLNWLQMDMRQLQFEPKSFRVIIEKATIDSLLVDERDPWRISQQADHLLKNVTDEIYRVLKDDGVFVSITFSQPHFRLPLYARTDYEWSVDVRTIGENFHYFVYVMTKGRTLNSQDLQKYLRASETKTEEAKMLEAADNENFINEIDLSDS